MRRHLGWIGMVAVLLLGVAFAAWNAGRLVTIDLGLMTLYRVPVTFVAFGGMVVGMGVMLLAGINADLKVRQLLRRRDSLDETTDHAGTSSAEGPEVERLEGTGDLGGDEIPETWDTTGQRDLPIE